MTFKLVTNGIGKTIKQAKKKATIHPVTIQAECFRKKATQMYLAYQHKGNIYLLIVPTSQQAFAKIESIVLESHLIASDGEFIVSELNLSCHNRIRF